MEMINSAFLKLKQVQGASNRVLFDTGVVESGVTIYSQLVGDTASTAYFASFGPWQSGYKVVSPNTVVCVEFSDGTTLMVLDGKFYARPAMPTSSPIKLIAEGGLPSSESDHQTYHEGDIVMAYTTLRDSGVPYAIDDFVIALCAETFVSEGSGSMTVSYTWVEIAHFPLSVTEESSINN